MQLAVLAGSGELHVLDVRTPGEFASLRIPARLMFRSNDSIRQRC